MLRNTPGGRWWVCRCRQCRSDDRGREDSEYRRNQRTREREELRVLVDEELARREDEDMEWHVFWFHHGVDGVPGYNGGRMPGFWDD
jgi:hypothetical protein